MAQAILRGVIDFSRDPWPRVSDKAKSLVRQMLEADPKRRLSAQQVLGNLSHPIIIIVFLFSFSAILFGCVSNDIYFVPFFTMLGIPRRKFKFDCAVSESLISILDFTAIFDIIHLTFWDNVNYDDNQMMYFHLFKTLNR